MQERNEPRIFYIKYSYPYHVTPFPTCFDCTGTPNSKVRIFVHVTEILFYKVLHEDFSDRYLGVKISNKIISESSSCLLYIFLFFFLFLREELCLSWIGRDWGSVDGQFVMSYIKRLQWRCRPCMHIIAFSRFSLESVL